jgi:hypothetical protein
MDLEMQDRVEGEVQSGERGCTWCRIHVQEHVVQVVTVSMTKPMYACM